MKTWLMPQVKVDVFSPNEFVAACIKFTADGPCGSGIAAPQGVMTSYDIVPPRYDVDGNGSVTAQEVIDSGGGGHLVYDQCGHHKAGDTAELSFGYIVPMELLAKPNEFWSLPVYYWQEGGNGAVHAIGYADVGTSGDGYEITNHS